MLPLLHVASMIIVLNVSYSVQEKDQGVQTVLDLSFVMAAIFVTSLPQDLQVAIVIVIVTVYHQLLFVLWVDVILVEVVLVAIVEETKIIQ